MKTKLPFTFTIFLLFFLLSAVSTQAQIKPQSPVFGSDVQIFSYFDCMHSTSRVSVADNGWIYVIAIVEAPGSMYQAWRIYRSTDDGVSFGYLCQWEYNTDDYVLKDVDMVVTGTDPSNINLWVAELSNSGYVNAHNAYARVTQWDANGAFIATPYYLDYGAAPNETYSISIATDYRSPGIGSTPFSIGIALTGNYGGLDWLNYAFSLDGGATFTGNDLYHEAGTNKLGRVSLAIGGTSYYTWGQYVIAFEMNKIGDLGDIGVLCNYTDNLVGAWLTPVAVNTLYPPASQNCRFPTVSVMDNIATQPAVGTFFPFAVSFEEWSLGLSSIDLMFVSLNQTVNPNVQPVLSDFTYYWMGSGSGYNEIEPNLAFDKTYNNFLLTYASGDNNQLYYKVSNIEDFQSTVWADFGNYRDANTPITWDMNPKVDINLYKAQACFSWVEQAGDMSESVYFDSEWSTVGVNEHPGSTQVRDFVIYPNPAMQETSVDIKVKGDYTLILSDMMGHEIMNKMVKGGAQTISLENLNKGIYMLRIFGKEFDSTKKLIVE